MIKKITVKKQLRLDELIKYVFDNELYPSHFESLAGFKIHFDSKAGIKVDDDYVHSDASVFTVEVEEEITNTTIFKSVVGMLNNDEIMLTNLHTTIEGIQDKYGSMKEIHAVINGKLQLIWEDESDE